MTDTEGLICVFSTVVGIYIHIPYKRFVKPAVVHDFWGMNCHCPGIALTKFYWVVQGVINSCGGCLFVLCKLLIN